MIRNNKTLYKNILLICFLLCNTAIYAQLLKIEYIISKNNKNKAISVNYDLLVEQQRSVFYPTSKCNKTSDEISIFANPLQPEIMVMKTDKISIFDKIGKAPFYYHPEHQAIVWNIKNESKEENGYTLMKAEAKFRGKEWEAWFIKDLPIPEGPYLFKGLPGLVYSVTDKAGIYDFQLKSIKKDPTEDCNLNLASYKELTEQKYTEALQNNNHLDQKLLESLMKLDIPKDGFDKLEKKVDQINILREL